MRPNCANARAEAETFMKVEMMAISLILSSEEFNWPCVTQIHSGGLEREVLLGARNEKGIGLLRLEWGRMDCNTIKVAENLCSI